jgi:ATP-binding cassette subfamily C protein
MSLRSLSAVLPRKSARKIYLLALARVMANLLDVIGLAGVALLATSFGSFAAVSGSSANINLPVVGHWEVTETQAVFVALIVAVTFLLKSVFSIWLNLRTALFVASVESDLSNTLAKDYFLGSGYGANGFEDSLSEFQNISSHSTYAIGQFINARISLFAEASLLLAMVAVFTLINPIATMAMFVYLAAVLFALGRLVTKRIKVSSERQLEGSEQALQSTRDLFGIRREVRASGVSQHWISKFTTGRSQWAGSTALIYTLNSLPRYVIETSLILGIFAFLAGVVVFSDLPSQAVTIGVFLAGGLRLVASLLPLQSAINSMIDGATRGSPALARLRALKWVSNSTTANDLAVVVGKPLGLRLTNVTFSFNGGNSVLEDVSFEVLPGSKVAIVGPSGAGKTTCFEIATGFRNPLSGLVRIDGNDPKDLLEHGTGAVGIVPQRSHLITGTIAENVSLESQHQTDLRKVRECLKQAGLNMFSEQHHLETRVEPDSGQLSGGEIQRLGIARALYRNPGILFLDEATSALDAETESQISKTLDGLRGRMTIVLIAHRLSTVLNADKVIYLENGRVLAEGTFKELQSRVPKFAEAISLLGLS